MMKQSTVGSGFRFPISGAIAAALLVLQGCVTELDSGVYDFHLLGVGPSTCEGHAPPPSLWDGPLRIQGETLLLSLSDPFFEGAVGGQRLTGRFFEDRDGAQPFIADTAFDTVLELGDLGCPAFFQLHLEAAVRGPGIFTGTTRSLYSVRREAPIECPRACVIELLFRAEKVAPVGDREI